MLFAELPVVTDDHAGIDSMTANMKTIKTFMNNIPFCTNIFLCEPFGHNQRVTSSQYSSLPSMSTRVHHLYDTAGKIGAAAERVPSGRETRAASPSGAKGSRSGCATVFYFASGIFLSVRYWHLWASEPYIS